MTLRHTHGARKPVMRLFVVFWLLINPVMGWGQLLPWRTLLPVTQPVVSSAPVVPTAEAKSSLITYQTEETPASLALTWQLDPAVVASAPTAQRAEYLWTAITQQMPTTRFGAYQLPIYLVPVVLTDDQPVAPQLTRLGSETWSGSFPAADPIRPALEDWASLGPPTWRELQTVPTAPVFLLREGRQRGTRLGVIGVSPFYVENGLTKVALDLHTLIPGAKSIDVSTHSTERASSDLSDFSTFTNQPIVLQPPAVGPTNPAATEYAFTLQVSHAGMQQLTGSALLAAGLQAATLLDQVQIAYQGTPIPVEVRDNDGHLDGNTELRFYVRPSANSLQVGDRWNTTETYWLTIRTAFTPPRMTTRTAYPQNAPLRQIAYARGLWEANQIYESTMAGVDGDHWFGAKLEIETVHPDDPASYPVTSITLTHALPLAQGSVDPSFFTLTGSARSIATHTLMLNLGKRTQALTWTNQAFYEDWQHTFTQTVQTDRVDMVLVAVFQPSMIRIDKLAWRQPVQLDFGTNGAQFESVAERWRYQLQNLPPDHTLYDITDPLAPVIVQIPAGTDVQFEDELTSRTYLVSGPGTLYTPTVAPHTPVALTGIHGADALYIAQAQFHDELAPLLAYRRQHGYQTEVIDVQQIYDSWSYGQVSPEAIRDFLRYAVSHWTPAPLAVTLVGDSTLDPHNYTSARNGVANVDLLPAYLAPIDPWISETACESCFAQLDGAEPLDQTSDPGFLIDIWVGRLSIQDEAQLTTVVGKILQYETSAERDPAAPWHRTALYLADNHVQANGTLDLAGDFAYLLDLISQGDPTKNSAPLQPSAVITRRLYYDPQADGVTEPWREPNATLARLRTIDEINQGPALVTYNGHGNHFLLATTDPKVETPYLFGANDIFELTNQDQLSIVLEMTCFTAQFTYLSPSGHTIDERFLRHTNGGAVAVWGSTGLTVSVGHEWMQQGFHRKLWSSPPLHARLGELIASGYASLFAGTTCCQETRYVYALLGDPLTPALLWAPRSLYLPLIRHE